MGARLGRAYPATRIWTPAKAPLVFDAVGAGNGGSGSSVAFSSNNVTAGATLFVDVTNRNNPFNVTSVTYGGTAMTLVDSIGLNNNSTTGTLARYKIVAPVAGPQTVQVNISGSSFWTNANSISVLHVNSLGASQKAFGTSTPSQSVSCSSNQIILQSLACDSNLTSPSGGTNRYNAGGTSSGLDINTATQTTTFTATIGAGGSVWAGLAHVLS